jgi:hypothetical protein
MKIPLPHSLELVHRLSVIRIILKDDADLMRFIFSHKNAELRADPKIMINEAGEELSRSEQILIRIAMDIWNGSGEARLPDILEILTANEILGFIHGILKFREIEPSWIGDFYP